MRCAPLSLILLLGCGGSGTFGGPADDDDATVGDDDDSTLGDDDDSTPGDDDDSTEPPWDPDAGLDDLLARTFRIDISRIELSLDFTPGADTVLGDATLTFTMRPGQTRPLFHFTPFEDAGDVITGLELNGEVLDPSADLLVTTLPGSTQVVREIQRDVDPEAEHTLHVTFGMPNWWEDADPGWLFTDVSDIAGDGNEYLFPTINAPDELARHAIQVRVHSERPYTLLGSGQVTVVPSQPGVQIWDVDTGREVASYTVLLVAMPTNEVDVEERVVNGVPMRVASIAPPADREQAFDDAAWVLATLEQDFGPLPMPALDVLLTTEYGGGMEYYGGTISDGWALQHEIVHMYFGCSTVARTWRDSWWDEAINIWYLWPTSWSPLPFGWGSDIVSGRTPVMPAFDTRAYDEGAAVFEQVADRIGGRQALIDVLRVVRDDHTFDPFTTADLIRFIEAETGVDLSEEFATWVYGNQARAAAIPAAAHSSPTTTLRATLRNAGP